MDRQRELKVAPLSFQSCSAPICLRTRHAWLTLWGIMAKTDKRADMPQWLLSRQGFIRNHRFIYSSSHNKAKTRLSAFKGETNATCTTHRQDDAIAYKSCYNKAPTHLLVAQLVDVLFPPRRDATEPARCFWIAGPSQEKKHKGM